MKYRASLVRTRGLATNVSLRAMWLVLVGRFIWSHKTLFGPQTAIRPDGGNKSSVVGIGLSNCQVTDLPVAKRRRMLRYKRPAWNRATDTFNQAECSRYCTSQKESVTV